MPYRSSVDTQKEIILGEVMVQRSSRKASVPLLLSVYHRPVSSHSPFLFAVLAVRIG